MGLIITLFIGLVVGVIAKFLMPGRDPGGFFITVALGIAGAFVAHFLGRGMSLYQDNEPAGFIASVLGAMLLLFVYRVVVGRKSMSH